MGDKIPSTDVEPPPAPPPFRYSNMAMLCYGLAIVGTAVLLFAIYNIIIIRCCTHRRRENSGGRLPPFVEATDGGSRSFERSNTGLLSSFKFKKENLTGIENAGEFECAVCLSVLEDGEEVRQLPGCQHAFHACCIDMWLYSHSYCPLCRARVQPPPLKSSGRRMPAAADNVSREVQLVSAAANAHFTPLL